MGVVCGGLSFGEFVQLVAKLPQYSCIALSASHYKLDIAIQRKYSMQLYLFLCPVDMAD